VALFLGRLRRWSPVSLEEIAHAAGRRVAAMKSREHRRSRQSWSSSEHPPMSSATRGVKARQGDRGAALVEFALIFPLLATLLFGVLSGGLLMNRRESITHAAREGARYGATVAANQCTPATNCGGLDWAHLVQSIVFARADGDLTPSAQVCVALVSGSGSDFTPPAAIDASHTTAGGTTGCYVDNSADTGKRVQVKITQPDELNAVFVHFSVDLKSNATAQFEQ
jgi:Flp pilus assembly protein TadG